MKNRGSTPILTNLVGVHPRNIHTKFEEIRAAVQEKKSKNQKSLRRRRRRQGERRRRQTQGDR